MGREAPQQSGRDIGRRCCVQLCAVARRESDHLGGSAGQLGEEGAQVRLVERETAPQIRVCCAVVDSE